MSITTTARAAQQMEPQVRPPVPSCLSKLDPADRALLIKTTREPVEYIAHPIFCKPNADKLLFGSNGKQDGRSTRGAASRPAHSQTNAARGKTPVTFNPEQEQQAFQRYNYARFHVFCTLKRYESKRLSAAAVRRLLLWQKRALDVRSEIVQANIPLVLAMAKRSRLASVDFPELVSEGNMALLRSVDKFDISRGFKFSTYACRAILKSFSRVAMRASRYRTKFPVEFDPALEKSDYIERQRAQAEDACVDELRDIMANNEADLNDVEQKVIRARFALDTPISKRPLPMTLEQVGRIIGVTKERVRQIQNRALDKLRGVLEEAIVPAS
ncbi:MAG TPA: sigma-70 family RNA polymerase sigma factor [Phycisphaerae bacterium]|nr:sigma-70 family RNA polymerase sigma factor [Phycisphaerae bacterium]